MSDFFMSYSDDYWKNKKAEQQKNTDQETPTTSVLSERAKEYNQAKAEHYENWNRYGVEVPDEYYKVFNQIISKAESPEDAQEEAYKIGSAVKYSQMMNIPIEEAYQNVDAWNGAYFPDAQNQKSRYEAVADMWNLGTNNLKLGHLGNQLKKAQLENDTELVNSLMGEINAINQQNELMQDNVPRTWVMEALKAGAQSLPFTLAVASAGTIGNFIGAGTGAAMAASSYLSAGQEYINMIANGASPKTARIVSDVSGLVQGLIEANLGITKSLVKSSAKAMGKEAAKEFAVKAKEEIGRKVFKRFHFGPGVKLLVNYLKNYGKDVLGEGLEEFWQEITSIVGEEVAASLDGYDLPNDDIKSVTNQVTEAFKGGILGAISLGVVSGGLKTVVTGKSDIGKTIKQYKNIRTASEDIESEEVFYNKVKDSNVFEGMSEESKKETIRDIWEKGQQRKNEAVREITETRDAAEGAEENVKVDEKGEEYVEVNAPARDEHGQLFTQNKIFNDDNGNETGGRFLVGDRTSAEEGKEGGARYGYINWEYDADDKNKIIIKDFKMVEGREGLRGEVYDDFAREHAGSEIEWNPITKEAIKQKESLVENNPAGTKNGLNYYKDIDAVTDANTRARVAAEIRKNIHNIEAYRVKNTDGKYETRYKRTELSNNQLASAVSLLEAAAKAQKMSLSDYVDKTFGTQIFGNMREFAQRAASQGDTTGGKAGGMGWKQYGQQIKAVIYAGENADFSTWTHELAHVFQSQLEGDLKAQAEKAFNVVNGDWINSKYTFKDGHTDSAAEAFAYGFQDWLKTGKAESEEMKNIFQKFAEFVARAFNSLKNFINLTPEIENVYNQLLSGDDSLLKAAELAVEKEDKNYRAQLKAQAEAKENAKKAEAEQQKKSQQAEREEKSETTEYTEKEEKLTPEQAEQKLDEVTKNEKKSSPIDNALKNTNLTDAEKTEIADVLKNENSTVIEKAEAVTEAASSAYDTVNDIPADLFFQTTDLTQDFIDIQNGTITEKDVENHIKALIGQVFDTATAPLKIQLVNGSKAHIINSNIKLSSNRKKKHNAALNKIESIINNAVIKGKSQPVDFSHNTSKKTLKHKQDVLKYVTFESPVKISNDYYTAELITERIKNQDPALLDLYNVRVKKNTPANALSNPNGLSTSSQGQLNNTALQGSLSNVLFQIAGEIGAQNLDNAEVQEGVSRMQNLAIAKQMEADNKDAKTIRLATGWEKGSDGKWRYEIDDSKFETDFVYKSFDFRKKYPRYTELEKKLEENNFNWEKLTKAEQTEFDELGDIFADNYYKHDTKLSEILDAKELYTAYPELKDVPVIFTPRDFNKGYEGQMRHGKIVDFFGLENEKPYYEIEINTLPDDYNSNIIRSTLLHEIQHIIQYIEGFGKGGDLEKAALVIEESNKKKKIEKNKALAWAWRNELIATEKEHPELRGTTKIMDALLEEYKEDNYDIKRLEEEGWIPEEDVRIKGFNLYVRGYDKEGYEDAYNAWGKNVGFYKPENINDWSKIRTYKRFAGEVEARNVQKRINFTPEERREALLAATEDVARDDQIILFQTAYHGSGADFDKFDTENFGLSGEGSMSFGYGTYVTDSEEIARDYAERQRKQFEKDADNPYERDSLEYEMFEDLRSFDFNKDRYKEYLLKESENIKKDKDNPYQDFKADNKLALLDNINSTNLYTVEIPDNGFILWDEDVDTKTKKYVENAVFEKLTTEPNEDGEYVYKGAERELREELKMTFEADINGQELYNNVAVYLGDEKAASKFLNKLGFAGINYPAYSNFGNAMGKSARNFVIFNDEDAKIVDHLFFQTQAELMDEARSFDSWPEFMSWCETMHADDKVSPIPSTADAQWYQSFWETANDMQTEAEQNEQEVQQKYDSESSRPMAMDALFITSMRSNPEMLDDFLHTVARIDAVDFNSEEWAQVADEEDAAYREKIADLKDFISYTLHDYSWGSAIKKIQGGGEITEGHRKRLLGEITNSFKARDFRALYAEVMNDPQFAVAEEDSIAHQLAEKLSSKKYKDILQPGEDISRVSPERRRQVAEEMSNREIAAKFANGTLKLNDDVDAYFKSLKKQVKEAQKKLDELELETEADYKRIASAETKDLLKLHEELILARGKLGKHNAEIERKIAKGIKITEKYQKQSQNLKADYNEIFRKFSDLKKTIAITAEVQAALDRQEQVAEVKQDLNQKQKDKSLAAEIKKMRIQLVKRTMRRVPLNRIDYEKAKTVIAIQRMLEPNLLGGVNRFIGVDSAFLRGVISGIVTDSEYKQKILNYLSKTPKASKAFAEFKKKIEELKSIKDFDTWTARERKNAIRYLPKENWVRELNLNQLAKEREEAIDLDIETVEKTVMKMNPETGLPMTDKEGNKLTETAFSLKYSDEIGQLVKDAVGADMFDLIVNKPFSEWTTEELEQLAQRIDELYTEGRELKAAKDEARRKEAERIRLKIENAIKDTGIVINDDDPPEVKEKKLKKINKVLGLDRDLKGTEAAKDTGIKAKFNRLIHGYQDANILRVARILDNQSEGENVRQLYRREDVCFNEKQRRISERSEKIKAVMKENNITEESLMQSIPVKELGTSFTVDELIFFLAADKDYEEDEKLLAKGAIGLDANDDYAATSRNAVMFGNMMSDTMSQDEKENWDRMDREMEEAIKNDTLTADQRNQQTLGTLDTRPGTTAYIARCHSIWNFVLGVANNYLSSHPEYKALMEAIEQDYAEQYERMNRVSIEEFNSPVHRVKAYVPLVRRESNGDTNTNQVREDLLAAYGGENKQWVNKGMTQRRVNISPLHQKPVQTGLFRTWCDSIERTEHFIAYAPYVRQLNAIYKGRDSAYTRRFIEARYGKPMLEYIDSYINEVANPNAGKIREKGAEFLHVLRGKTAPAYLGWKFSAIVKQAATSPWPYMQFVNPAEYFAAATKCWTSGGKVYDAIKEKSAFMASRVMDPINELVDEMAEQAKTKADRAWSNFSKKGMAGLEWIDWTCVAPGWLACYEKEYNRLQAMTEARYQAKVAELQERNQYEEVGTSAWMDDEKIKALAQKETMQDIEAEAVQYADDCTRQCQPSSRATDLAPLFKNKGEAMKAFLQFQTSLNVIWQNLRYDIPYAIKQKQFNRIVGTVCGYVFAGIFMNSVMDGVFSGAKDDDDKKGLQALRNLIYYATTQFTDAVPMVGSEITNTLDYFITGKRAFGQGGTDMTPTATKFLSALNRVKSGNWTKAAELTAEGIGLYFGAPVSGVKEIHKLLGKPIDNGNVDIPAGVSDVYGLAGDIIDLVQE